MIIRYHKETKFYKSLEEWEANLDVTNLNEAESPFEQIVEERLKNQTEWLKKTSTLQSLTLEQEKDELLSWIHEVKTPLTAMQLMIDRLEDNSLKAQLTHEWLRVHLLLDQQLHQKRIPFMKNDLYIEKVALRPLIFEEIKTLKFWCIQKGIGFHVEIESTEVLTDGKWLGFILRQLLTNAVKYSQASDIEIRTYEQDGQVKLEIRDFGRGINRKDLPRIFEKGFTSTTEHHDNKATGMGLYLAKKAAESLFIHIAVQSEVGKGTVFTLRFPKRNQFHYITGM
ncbi:histidine kinase [Pueribacillus theae]|uniref:histidine kinase n=1 Tax=Pueribacillus theae TaxID=2171751 RepID=A0A2U1JWZ0_9BACI|nr:histidine kinase [Pueribacillus theae]